MNEWMDECRLMVRYFIRVSGKSVSHVCVECALETHPTLVLISEEIESKVSYETETDIRGFGTSMVGMGWERKARKGGIGKEYVT